MAAKSKLTAFEDLDDATCALDIGTFRRRQIHKQVLEKYRRWALVLFQCQDWKEKTGVWGKPIVIIQRYVRTAGKWRRHSHINLRNSQAMGSLQIVATWEAMAKSYAERGIDIGAAVEAAEAGAKPKRKARRHDAEPPADPPAQPT
jgi:hypothetical protein